MGRDRQTLQRMDEEQEQALQRQHGPNRSDLDALRDGAAMLSAAGNRVAALSLLWSAVAIDPLDLASHRRLAATLAGAGDLDGAAEEFARYIDFVLPVGDLARAMLELSYGVNMLGGRAPMRGAAQKIADAVLALVPAGDVALPQPTSPSVVAAIAEAQLTTPVSASTNEERVDLEQLFTTTAPASFAPDPEPATTRLIENDVAARVDKWTAQGQDWTDSLPLADPVAERRAAEAIVMKAAAVEPIFIRPAAPAAPAFVPRVVPKVPFRFCLHPGGDRHWMQLEGGTPDLVPDAVRVIDRFENVVEERLCLRMRPGDQGHSPVTTTFDIPPLVWVVVSVPSQIVAAYEAGLTWAYTFKARVNGDWLAVELIDSGCRLGGVRSRSAS